MGARIIRTDVKYRPPLVNPRRHVNAVARISVLKNSGPCRQPRNIGQTDSLTTKAATVTFAF